MNVNHSLVFHWTTFGLAASIAVTLAAIVLGLLAWKRSGYARGTALLELLRVALVILVCLTLNQPEWLEEFLPSEQPTLLVLSDASRSMETRDVTNGNDVGIRDRRSRAEAIASLAEPERWASLAEKFDVQFQTFSSTDQANLGTDISSALTDGVDKHKNLRGIVLLSDGDWNSGEPPARAASRLRIREVPVFCVGAGSESRLPDIELARFDVPSFGVISKPMRIPFSLSSALPQDHATTVTLTTSTGQTITHPVVIPAMGRIDDAVVWTPESLGDIELSLSVPVDESEIEADNNQRKVPISIREETIKVLLIESRPRWEYRYLRNALERDPGVDVACLLFHPGLTKVGGGKGYLAAFPETMEQLSKYDVVFLGDVELGGDQLTADQCRLLKGLVQSQASGLILMPGIGGGHLSLAESDLKDLYPVVLDPAQPRGWGSRVPWQFELTESGRRSLLTKLEDTEDDNARIWESLPGFQWYAPVLRTKAGTEVLATHRTESGRYGRIPLIVTRTFGTGKVLFMGTDGAWRWREGVEDKYHYRFWGQVARWMAYQRNIAQGERMRLFFSPDRPETNTSVVLNANVMSSTGEPLQEGLVAVNVVSPSGQTERIRLAPNNDEWGLFTGTFTPRERGNYDLKLTCRENDSSLQTTLAVQGVDRERLGQPARYDVLDEIASITQGDLVESDNLDELARRIAELPEPEPQVRRLRIWCHPAWVGFLILLLGVFWTGRKIIGAI